MRVPIRRGEKENRLPFDPHMTQEKYDELKIKLERLKNHTRFKWMNEVATQAEGGDFSENAGYQAAKAKLRGVNQAILDLEFQLKKAIIIKGGNYDYVELGTAVTVEANGKQKTYQLLGSSEVDPLRNIISHNSPLGSALMGKRVGDRVRVPLRDGIIEYMIIKIV